MLWHSHLSAQFNYAKYLQDNDAKPRHYSRSRFTVDAFSLPFALTIIADWIDCIYRIVAALLDVFSKPSSLLYPVRVFANDMFGTSSLFLTISLSNSDLNPSVQQVDIRLHQAVFLIRQSRLLQSHKQWTLASFSSQYVKCVLVAFWIFLSDICVSFYNCVWLISNDIIVGTAFGAFLCENNVVLARLLGHAVEVCRFSEIIPRA